MAIAFQDERSWFNKKRFGLFIHWGIYALGERHEQEQWRYNIPAAIYEKYADRFDPVKFDPAQWLDLCQECGMEYLVFTVKHHDGFCMWDTKETTYNIMNTPYKKDITAINSEIAMNFLWDYVTVIKESDATPTTLENTFAQLGVDVDLAGYEEHY